MPSNYVDFSGLLVLAIGYNIAYLKYNELDSFFFRFLDLIINSVIKRFEKVNETIMLLRYFLCFLRSFTSSI